MARIPGASQFLNQATLTNLKGYSAVSSNFLGTAAGSVSILDIGQNLASPGIGISNRARNLNRQLIDQNAGNANQLFSASVNGSATVENALTQIKGLMSKVPSSRDTPAAREAQAEAQAQLQDLADIAADEAEQEEATSSSRGSILDQSV